MGDGFGFVLGIHIRFGYIGSFMTIFDEASYRSTLPVVKVRARVRVRLSITVSADIALD